MADIRKRTTGKGVSYQVRYLDAAARSGHAYRSFPTRKAAQAFKAERDVEESGLIRGLGLQTEIRSVPQAVDLWLDICERVGRDGREPIEVMTLKEYRRRANVMLRHPWRKPIQRLEPADIVQFRTWLLETVSRDLARRTLSSFHSVLLEMKLQGVICDDPAAGITVRAGGRYDDEESRVEIPSDQEMRDILAATAEMGRRNDFMEKCWARYRPMIHLLAFSGLRSSELRGLSWSNLHEDRVEVRQRADKRGVIGPVKSRAGRRTIELPTRVVEMIVEWRERCPESELDLVFPTAQGKPIALANIRNSAWIPLLREAGLTTQETVEGRSVERARYTPHALRHFYASKLIEKKKDAKFIQERMGHARIEITFDVYGHLMKDRDEAHRRTAEELADELLLD